MFTIYIDDSGSAPDQKMAVATGIILPAAQLIRFESEWTAFLKKEDIPDFHASECLAKNPHSPFADWDDARVERVFARVRQITFKYSVKGYCTGIHKQDYEEVLTQEMKTAVGQSYFTWAVSSLLGLAHDWAFARSVPMEYVFSDGDKAVKREIEDSMAVSEKTYGDHFLRHYSFRKRREIPVLQAVDLFAWSCFQGFQQARFKHRLHPIALASREAYVEARNREWSVIQSQTREALEKWVEEKRDDPRTKEILELKEVLRESRKPKRKLKPSA